MLDDKVKCVFMGGRNLGLRVLEWLCNQPWVEIAAVCQVPRDSDEAAYESIRSLIDDKKLPVYTVEEISTMSFHFGLSVNWHRILSQQMLDTCSRGFYNIHHSYNLRLRGRHVATHAILNRLEEGISYHGTTLHAMSAQLDDGGIVASRSCEIERDDTAYSLFCRTDSLAFDLVTEWLPRIAFEQVFPYTPPTLGVRSYRAADLPTKEVSERMDAERFRDYVRAFDCPGYKPAFIVRGGNPISLVLKPRDEFTIPIHLQGAIFYTDNGLI